MPRSTVYRALSIGLGALLLLATYCCWKLRGDYYAVYGSLHNDWQQVEVIEHYRQAGLGGSVSRAAECLQYVVEFKLPDGYGPPTATIETNLPSFVPSSRNMKRAAFTKLRRMVEIERSAAVGDIIAHLRAKTGSDLGGDPQKWIETYARSR